MNFGKRPSTQLGLKKHGNLGLQNQFIKTMENYTSSDQPYAMTGDELYMKNNTIKHTLGLY